MIWSARPVAASTDNDYDYLVQGLAAHFDGSTSQQANRIQFQSLRQAETESAIDFAHRVQYVGRQCNFGSDEASSFVDQRIVGLVSEHQGTPAGRRPSSDVQQSHLSYTKHIRSSGFTSTIS